MTETNATGVAYYHSLKRNMVLVVIMVSITPMIVVSGLILYLYQNTYRDKTYAHLGEVVQRHKQNIDCFLKERRDDIRFLSRTFTFEELSEEARTILASQEGLHDFRRRQSDNRAHYEHPQQSTYTPPPPFGSFESQSDLPDARAQHEPQRRQQ